MSLWRFKSAFPRPARVSFGVFGLAPLSRCAIEQAFNVTVRNFSIDNLPLEGPVYQMALQTALLRRAVYTADDIPVRIDGLEILEPHQNAELFSAWCCVHDESTEPYDELEAYLELQIAARDEEAVGDVYRCQQCDTALEFYGVPAIDLTDGQLTYFFACRAVYEIAFASREDGKKCVRNLGMIREKARRLSESVITWERAVA